MHPFQLYFSRVLWNEYQAPAFNNYNGLSDDKCEDSNKYYMILVERYATPPYTQQHNNQLKYSSCIHIYPAETNFNFKLDFTLSWPHFSTLLYSE